MKKAPTSPFSSPKCQLPEAATVEEKESRSRIRRKQPVLEGSGDMGRSNTSERILNVRFGATKQESASGDKEKMNVKSGGGEEEGAIRRTRTVPTKMGVAAAAYAAELEKLASLKGSRQRRDLSSLSKDDGDGDELLVDAGKRVSSSSRNLKLKAIASERSLQTLSTKYTNGRAATPLDIPFIPQPALSRAVSADPDMDAFLDDVVKTHEDQVSIRRTRTQLPPQPTSSRSNRTHNEPSSSSLTGPSTLEHSSSLRLESIFRSQRTDSMKNRTAMNNSDSSLSINETEEYIATAQDSSQDLKNSNNDATSPQLRHEDDERRLNLQRKDTALPDETDTKHEIKSKKELGSCKLENEADNTEEMSRKDPNSHVIHIEGPSRKMMLSKDKSAKKVIGKSVKGQSEFESCAVDGVVLNPLSWWQLLLHYVSLLFVEYPFKYHKQWLDKMYKGHRLERPPNYHFNGCSGNGVGVSVGVGGGDWALSSIASSNGPGGLPSLPENSSSFRAPPRNARVRRRTHLDDDDPRDEFSTALEVNHTKRVSSIGGTNNGANFTPTNRPPPGHLPRSQNIGIERGLKKGARRSVEIFGDIMHALGLNATGKGRLKYPFGLSEMDESELTGFQARFYNFIKRHHKGRLARAWDHLIRPLDSMQKKHRRSRNKARLLNAIDKYRAQKFENNYDAVKTTLFLCGQWFFEALSPPKYTKKPMLLTVLFPLVLILFFAYMAGEYSFWTESQGDMVESYEFGPQELSKWFLKSDTWRTFDDHFLIIWGARYLPKVTSESWRWLFSMLVHENFAHLGGNILLFVLLSWSLESKYGFWRTGLICWLSGITGNFMSAAFEDSCGIVLGASGCVFGLSALYITDVIGDFKSVSFPCLRLIGIITFLCAFLIALTSHQEASHMSHIGGFLTGLCLGTVLVPRFIDERIEALLPCLAFIAALTLLCVLPLVVFCSILPNLECSS